MELTIIKMFGSINSLSLLAIPFFIIAGNLIMRAKITDRLVSFSDALVGWLKGGLGHVNIVSSMLFGGIQGSGAADAAAIGGMLILPWKNKVMKGLCCCCYSRFIHAFTYNSSSIAMILYATTLKFRLLICLWVVLFPHNDGSHDDDCQPDCIQPRDTSFRLQIFNKNLLRTSIRSLEPCYAPDNPVRYCVWSGNAYRIRSSGNSYGLFMDLLSARLLSLRIFPNSD